jgi:hypothetical protein
MLPPHTQWKATILTIYSLLASKIDRLKPQPVAAGQITPSQGT